MSTRREFLQQSLAITGGLGLAGCAGMSSMGTMEASSSMDMGTSSSGIFPISLAQWSLVRRLRAGELDNLDFARVSKNTFGIDAIEYVNQFFSDKAEDMDYLREMKTRADGEGVYQHLIMIDNEGDLGNADPAARRQAVENHYKWIDAAAFLGCVTIRVNARGTGTYEEQMQQAIEGLRGVTEYGAQAGINVIVENHGGLSSNAKWLIAVMEGVDHPRCGTLPDFGNFNIGAGEQYDRYLGTEEMMPYAKGVSAKAYRFDENGEEVDMDYHRLMRIVLDAGYRSYVGVEFEGPGEPEVGIMATKALLERVREELTPEYT
ncbi:sugar phosphate isomerase/epimerase family protein [Candidatus Neomarinimicrobiota bacterium]